jgi:hypothetical protein
VQLSFDTFYFTRTATATFIDIFTPTATFMGIVNFTPTSRRLPLQPQFGADRLHLHWAAAPDRRGLLRQTLLNYTCDEVGNRLTASDQNSTIHYVYDDANRMTAAGEVEYGWGDTPLQLRFSGQTVTCSPMG